MKKRTRVHYGADPRATLDHAQKAARKHGLDVPTLCRLLGISISNPGRALAGKGHTAALAAVLIDGLLHPELGAPLAAFLVQRALGGDTFAPLAIPTGHQCEPITVLAPSQQTRFLTSVTREEAVTLFAKRKRRGFVKKKVPVGEKPTSNRAALYVRVSTIEQRNTGHSLAGQEEELRTYCAFRKLDIAEVIIDAGVSGTKPFDERAGGARLMELVRGGEVHHVVAWKLDRCFRSTVDCLNTCSEWQEIGVALHLTTFGGQAIDTSTGLGRFLLTLFAGIAQLERDVLVERTLMGLDAARKKGVVLGRRPVNHELEEFVLARRGQHLTRIVEAANAAGLTGGKDKDGKPSRVHVTTVQRIIARQKGAKG